MMVEGLQGKSLKEAEALTAAFKGMMQGKELTEAEREELRDLEALEGVKKYPIRIKCALLPWITLQEGIEAHRAGK